MTAETEFELADVMRLTGAKRSQVEHWVRSGIVRPAKASTGTGDARKFTVRGVVETFTAGRLATWGISVPKMALIFECSLHQDHYWAALIDRRRRARVAVLAVRPMSEESGEAAFGFTAELASQEKVGEMVAAGVEVLPINLARWLAFLEGGAADLILGRRG